PLPTRSCTLSLHDALPISPDGVVVLKGAKVITMRGDEVLASADIVVRNGRIQSVSASGSTPPPQGAKVIDLGGNTIVPGFIDTQDRKSTRLNSSHDQISYA